MCLHAARYGGGPPILRHWHQQQQHGRDMEDLRPELLIYPIELIIASNDGPMGSDIRITVSRSVSMRVTPARGLLLPMRAIIPREILLCCRLRIRSGLQCDSE